jgi:hypothetical protein
MKKILSLAFALVVAAGTAHTATADPIGSGKTPEQVGDLYLATLFGNHDKTKELSNYLLPYYTGEHKTDLLNKSMIKMIAFHATISSAASEDSGNSEISAAVKIIQSLLQHSICHTTNSTIHTSDSAKSPVTTLTYECHVPDIDKTVSSIDVDEDKGPTQKEFDQIMAAINAAPANKIITGKFDLHSDTKYHVWFIEGDFFDTISGVMDNIMSSIKETSDSDSDSGDSAK